jgi:hypothetical protein
MDMTKYYIHPSYKTKQILEFVEEIICDYSYRSFSDVTLSDKYKLASMLSIQDGYADLLSFLTESNNADQIMALFRKSITSPKQSHTDAFLEALKETYLDYYVTTMENLFNYVKEGIDSDKEAYIDHVRIYGDEDAAYDNYRSNNL